MGYRWLSHFGSGLKKFGSLKNGIGNVFDPIKKIEAGISKGFHSVDGWLDRLNNVGVPRTVIDLLRGNPYYAGVSKSIDFADDLIADVSGFGNVIIPFVEHSVFEQASQIASRLAGSGVVGGRFVRPPSGIQGTTDGARITASGSNPPLTGFQVPRQPTSRQRISFGVTA